MTFGLHSVADTAGNIIEQDYYWSFAYSAPECGRAEFVRISHESQVVINSASMLNAAGDVMVSIFNPNVSAPSWEANARVQVISLLYRVVGSNGAWQPALLSNGSAATFDFSVRAEFEF